MWQKNGKGQKYKGHYIRDARGERVMCLTAILKNGQAHTVTAESWQMFKALGWVKVA